MRRITLPAVLLALTSTLGAQDPELTRPSNWLIRFDRPGTHDSTVYFVDMPPGWHVTTGPAAILYDPAAVAEGTFEVTSEVYLFPGERREGYGIFVGGRSLQGPDQTYAYFLLRKDGRFLIKLRRGSETEVMTPWTEHAAVVRHDGGEGTVKNVLGIHVTAATVRFSVNGEEVASHPRATIAPDGIVGLRVNHALNVHVTNLEVQAGR
jgi:hypothetical protein